MAEENEEPDFDAPIDGFEASNVPHPLVDPTQFPPTTQGFQGASANASVFQNYVGAVSTAFQMDQFMKREEERVKKDEQDPLKITWKKLKVGMHLKLACACEGFVQRVSNPDNAGDKWFEFVYTSPNIACKAGQMPFGEALRVYYEECVVYPEQYKSDIYFEPSFPFTLSGKEVPAPEWFRSLEKGPRSSNMKRCIRVRLKNGNGEPINFIIPGFSIEGNVYSLATALRFLAGERPVDIEVGSMDEVENWKVSLDKVRKMSDLKDGDKNEEALHDWLMDLFKEMFMGGVVNPPEACPLNKTELIKVLERVKKHPLWKGHTVNLKSKDGWNVVMDDSGKIA